MCVTYGLNIQVGMNQLEVHKSSTGTVPPLLSCRVPSILTRRVSQGEVCDCEVVAGRGVL